jgi:hypothetical protein
MSVGSGEVRVVLILSGGCHGGCLFGVGVYDTDRSAWGGQSGRAARLPRYCAWMLAVPLRAINGFPGCHGGLSLGVLGHLARMPGLG